MFGKCVQPLLMDVQHKKSIAIHCVRTWWQCSSTISWILLSDIYGNCVFPSWIIYVCSPWVGTIIWQCYWYVCRLSCVDAGLVDHRCVKLICYTMWPWVIQCLGGESGRCVYEVSVWWQVLHPRPDWWPDLRPQYTTIYLHTSLLLTGSFIANSLSLSPTSYI